MNKQQLVTYDQVKSKIIEVRNQQVILDSDVADLYGVETREINQAVKNNTGKFPEGYLLELDKEEKNELIKNFDRFDRIKHSSATIKGFTERGLYMLATILKSPRAVATTIAIIDTFAKIKELTQSVYHLADVKNEVEKVKSLENSATLIGDLLLDNDLIVSQDERSMKIKLPFFELTRKVTRIKK